MHCHFYFHLCSPCWVFFVTFGCHFIRYKVFPFAHFQQTIVHFMCLCMHFIWMPMSCAFNVVKLRVQQFVDTMNSSQLTKINVIWFDAIKLVVATEKPTKWASHWEERKHIWKCLAQSFQYWLQQTHTTQWSIVIFKFGALGCITLRCFSLSFSVFLLRIFSRFFFEKQKFIKIAPYTGSLCKKKKKVWQANTNYSSSRKIDELKRSHCEH